MSYLQALNAGLINPTNQPASYSYNTLVYPVESPTQVGYTYNVTATGVPIALTVYNGTYTSLFEDNIEYPAGIYTFNLFVSYDCTDAGAVELNTLSIALVDDDSDYEPPYLVRSVMSPSNVGSITMSIPFFSNGTTKTKVILSYASTYVGTNPINITALNYTLTKIG
jgi:hypothetical protein